MGESDSNSRPLSVDLIAAVGVYIQDHYVPEAGSGTVKDGNTVCKGSGLGEEHLDSARIELREGKPVLSKTSGSKQQKLEDAIGHVGETFQQRLFRLIDSKGLSDTEVYKRAHIDRKLFSKIRGNENYTPRKKNVIALALALQLNLDETVDLLRRAEMALSPSSKSDLIIEYCIRNRIYDINTVNELLDEYGQEILG